MSIATAGRFLVLPAAFFAGCWFNLPEARTGPQQYHSAAARNTKVLQGFRSGQLDDVVIGFGRLVPQAGKAAQKQGPVDSAHSPHSAHTPLPHDGAGGMRKILFASGKRPPASYFSLIQLMRGVVAVIVCPLPLHVAARTSRPRVQTSSRKRFLRIHGTVCRPLKKSMPRER